MTVVKGVIRELDSHGVNRQKAKKLMNAVKTSGRPAFILAKERKKLKQFTEAEKGIDELETIIKESKAYGIQNKIEIDFSLVRGLAYYTGPIFEIVVKSKKSVGSVAGGGRYDNLIELYGGKWTPAVGISLGIERLYEIMLAENMFKTPKTLTKVFVVSVDNRVRKHALLTAQALRNNRINTQADLMGRNMKKQLEYANTTGIPFVIFMGEREWKEKKFTLKNMKTGKQKKLTLEDIVKEIKKS